MSFGGIDHARPDPPPEGRGCLWFVHNQCARAACVLGAGSKMIDIYTCITAGYDDLKKQPVLGPHVRYRAFVEGVQRPLPPWVVSPVESVPEADPTRRAREMKVLAHRAVPDAEWSLWVDGCFVIRPDFQILRWLSDYMQDADLVTFQHTADDCTYQHATRIVQVGLDRAPTVVAQMQRYREGGLPEHAGMVQTNVMLRKHTPAVQAFNERWWQEIQAGSRRDQLSFVWAARETGLKYRALPVHERQYFHGKSHRGVRTNP